MEKRDIANEILDARLINCIQPIFTAAEIEVVRFYKPYVKVYPVFNMDGQKQIYERAHCEAATEMSFREYMSTHDKLVVIAKSFLDGSAQLYVNLPENPDFPGDVNLSKEWAKAFDALLVEKLGMPKDEYMAPKLNVLLLKDITKQANESKKDNAKPVKIPELSDLTVDFGADKIVDILVDKNNKPLEITYDVSEKDLLTLTYRSCAKENLQKNGKLSSLNSKDKQPEIIARFTDNKLDVFISGDDFILPVPATRHEKDQIRDTALEYIKQHDAKWQKPGKTNKNKPTQIGK